MAKKVLICDKCGAENWNLAALGNSHDQQANPIKGYDACNGVWRLPRSVEDRKVAADIATILRAFAAEDEDEEADQ